MGNSGGDRKQLGGAGGKGSAQPHQPLTPATAAPKPCASRRGRRR
jgi:hypothetical protein